jgi:hypothetical protein
MKDTRNHPHDSGCFVGSAVVLGAAYGLRTTLLKLQTFAGEYFDYTIDSIPDPTGIAEFRSSNLRPISVKIEDCGKRCSVIALSQDGPRRSSVTLSTALALHQSGVHAVVNGGLQLGVSCSTHERVKEPTPLG